MRRELFARLDDGSLRPEGFKILLYLYLQACLRLGPDQVRVSEVGFVFRERLHGRSKLTNRVMWEYLAMLYNFRRHAPVPWRFVRFAAVGTLGVVVNTLVLLMLREHAGWPYLLASALAIETAIMHNFILNDLWTFRDHIRRGESTIWRRFGRFQTVSLGGTVVNLAVLWLLHGLLGFPLLASNLVGIGGAVLYNYAANKLWTWQVGHPREMAASRTLRGWAAYRGRW
jgi:dolichol-phosphate mannosyltransferase